MSTKVQNWRWCLIFFGLAVALTVHRRIVQAQPASELQQRIQTNSNQDSGGILADRVLTIDLEVREGEWFPEDEHGPSVKVFAFAEKGKPAQIPGPMIRVRQGTVIHLHLQNLISPTLVMHGMHSRPGKENDALEVPTGAARDVSFIAGEPGAYYYWATAGGDTLNGRPYKKIVS